MEYWQNSYCGNGWLHKYEIKDQIQEMTIEVCERCGNKQFFKFINGRTDNLHYLSYHLRSALPKQHPQFKKEYEESI